MEDGCTTVGLLKHAASPSLEALQADCPSTPEHADRTARNSDEEAALRQAYDQLDRGEPPQDDDCSENLETDRHSIGNYRTNKTSNNPAALKVKSPSSATIHHLKTPRAS